MPSITRSFHTRATPAAVFDYLRDFASTEEWDPGTRSTERVSGDGEVGTNYRNVSSFLGNSVELTYTTTELVPEQKVHFVGRNKQFEGHDLLTFRPEGEGTEVTYHADFAFRGVSRLFAPVAALYLPRLARHTIEQLQDRLDRLA